MDGIKKWLADNTKIWISVLIGIVFAWGLINYVVKSGNLLELEFDKETIASYTPETTGLLVTIGGTITDDHGKGDWDVVPNIDLHKGYYEYVVSYESQGAEGSELWLDSYSDHYNAVEGGLVSRIKCAEGSNTDSMTYWQNVRLPMTLRVNYTGTGKLTVTGLKIYESDRYPRSQFLLAIAVCFLLVFVAGYIEYRRKIKPTEKDIMIGACLVGAVILSSILSFYSKVFIGNDLVFHLGRIQGLAEGLMDGQFPVRINPFFYVGYGYADPVMYGNLLLYFPALLYLGGMKLTVAYNVYCVFMNIVTVGIGYYSFKRIFNNRAYGVIATVLYAMAPYRIMDIYLRAAAGEYTAMAFYPLVAYGMYRIYTDDPESEKFKKNFWPLVIGLTGVIEAHILSTEMCIGVLAVSVILLIKRTVKVKRLLQLVKAAVMTLLLNLWFIVPFLDYFMTAELQAKVYGTSNTVQDSGLFLVQLFSLFPKYYFDSSDAWLGISNDTPVTIGLGLLLALLLALVMIICKRDKKATFRTLGLVTALLAILCLWMSTVYFPWDTIEEVIPFTKVPIRSIQYVHRMLGPASVLAVISGTIGLIYLKDSTDEGIYRIGVTVLLLLTMLTSIGFMQETVKNQDNTWRFTQLKEIGVTTVGAVSGGEYTPIRFDKQDPLKYQEPVATEGISVDAYEKSGTNTKITVTSKASEDGYVILPTLWYKGYKASGDINMFENSGKATLSIPAGFSGEIVVDFVSPWYWRVAEIATVLLIIGLGTAHIINTRKMVNT